MYLPAHFAHSDPQGLRALIGAHPLATLVTIGADGPTADHLPLLLDVEAGPHGTLVGHVARANPLWRAAAGQRVLAVFHGPQAYVSPNWYPSKADTHKAVPTWNYAVVHAHGRLEAVDDREWLRDLVTRLTATQENRRPAPWAVADAPADYLEQMLRAIVGVRIPIERLVGKFKLSQNRSVADREGAASGIASDGQGMLSALMRQHAKGRGAADA